jgi:phenylpropionate dioxygenase-like ring-hydroxylating dioxygenase large terminal subunit
MESAMSLVKDLAESDTPLSVSSYRYPTGWYIVANSSDVPAGTLKGLHYFGQELICFRGESGTVAVMNAYCQHLGGHIGVGGSVVGDEVKCPWHAWQWRADGTNSLIPYSKEGCKKSVRIRTYPSIEWCGMVLMWFDRDGAEPTWSLPEVPELDTGDYYPLHPHSRMLNRVKVHPQMIVENAADPYHIASVHHGDRPAETTSFELHDYYLHATVDVNYGGGRPTTWLTPNGPVDGEIVYDTFGLGIGFVRFPENVMASVQITGHTPVDEEYTDYWFTMACRREEGDTGDVPTGRAARWIELQQEIIKQDFFTWEHMQYLEKPSFAVEEAKNYAALRRWCRRFYPADTFAESAPSGSK